MSNPGPPTPQTPWPAAVAMLAGCLSTLLGTISQLESETILWRAAVSALLLGALTALVRSLWRCFEETER